MLVLASAKGAERNTVPPLESIREIIIGAEPWWLRIAPDGSGRFGYGANDSASIPKGTYDFAKLFEVLVPVVHSKGKIPEFFLVAFHQRGVTTTYSYYTKRSDIILPLFETGQQKCVLFGGERIRELWQSRPPKSLE